MKETHTQAVVGLLRHSTGRQMTFDPDIARPRNALQERFGRQYISSRLPVLSRANMAMVEDFGSLQRQRVRGSSPICARASLLNAGILTPAVLAQGKKLCGPR